MSALRTFAGRVCAAYFSIRSLGRIRGSDYILQSPGRLRIRPGGEIVIGPGVVIEKGARIIVHAQLTIGSGVYIGKNATIVAFDSIKIGARGLIAENVSIHTEDHGPAGRRLEFITGPVDIGDDVWLGAGVVVTRNTSIGPRTTIGANAVVAKSIPSDSLAVGLPARVVRTYERE